MKSLPPTASNTDAGMNKKNPWSLKKKILWVFLSIIIFIVANFVYEYIAVEVERPGLVCGANNKGVDECHSTGLYMPHAPLFKLLDYISYMMIPEVSLPDLVWDGATDEMTRNHWFFTNDFPRDLGEQKIRYGGASYYVVFKEHPEIFYAVWQGSEGIWISGNRYMKPGTASLDVPQDIQDQIENIFKTGPDEYVMVTYNDTLEAPGWGIGQ